MPASLTASAIAGWVDPAAVFAGLGGADDAFWLDAGPDAVDGWSWVGIGDPAPPDEVEAVACTSAVADDAAGPFRGGWVGWRGYESGAAADGIPVQESPAGERWLRTRAFVAFDHARRRLWGFAPADAAGAASALVAAAVAAEPPPAPPAWVASARHTPRAYADLVERCRDRIRAGDAYQLCLTTRFTVPGVHDPAAVHARLRRTAGAHRGGIVRASGTALVTASPERFLDLRGGVVRTHPIKGTRPRGADAASDAALARELLASAKERAENVMIVDLMRNDLSRVCDPGTVTVERLLEVESYPTVHQLVSTVAGRLREGTTVGAVLAAAFPAGSMTGAPKHSAMTILQTLEGGPRGIYAGCYGWVGDDGSAGLAMVIRSVVVIAHEAYVGAGGGITWHSDAAAEVAEVGVKARAPLAAVGAALPPGW